MLRNQKGFTLIELLIVIVIIGILAGVLISVIDPTSQQNRARDAGIQASINKVVLATEGYLSAYGEIPTDMQFIGGFKDGSVYAWDGDPSDIYGLSCSTGTGDYECIFDVTGNSLSKTCISDWSGDDPAAEKQCHYRYIGICDSTGCGSFTIYAKSSGLAATVYKYENSGARGGQIQRCVGDPEVEANCELPK